ncbi:MAG: dienelactone hydrolase family protein [Sphingomonas sp.]|nr:dienelactone hydrolase family protein [Sphingomonas sp.]
MERRQFMRRMVALAGSVAAAEALIGAIAASPAAAAIVPETDLRLTIATRNLANGYRAYIAEPRTRSLKPAVMVIHENRGLNAHIRDVARRVALAGYRAVAPDFLSPSGGTPADEDAARDAIGKLELGKSVADAVAMLDELARASRGGKVGAVGFCWGGAFVNRLAVAAGDTLDAGVVYYGPAPDPSEAVRVRSPLMIHVPELDDRVKATAWPWVKALRAAGKPVTAYNYPGANHAFNNDTSAERFDKAAADLAWKRTLRFFRRHLR